MEILLAKEIHWQILEKFYAAAYRPNHPLQNKYFWDWQFGNPKYGQAIIAYDAVQDCIVGHLGMNFSDNLVWLTNLFIDAEKGKGLMVSELFDFAEKHGPLITQSATEKVMQLYRFLKWTRLADLERLIFIPPAYKNLTPQQIVQPVFFDKNKYTKPEGHFWEQPSLMGIHLNDGSTAIAAPEAGMIKFESIVNIKVAENFVIENGFRWADFLTSWNNPKITMLERKGWLNDKKNQFPWFLNPIDWTLSPSNSYLTKGFAPTDIYVSRRNGDLGRIGSLPNNYKPI